MSSTTIMKTLEQWIAENHVAFKAQPRAARPKSNAAWEGAAYHYRCTISSSKNPTRRLYVWFSQGSAHTKPPTAADVLDCLGSDFSSVTESFAEFCGNMGYDEDSRKAFGIYQTIQRQYKKFVEVFGVTATQALMYETERQ